MEFYDLPYIITIIGIITTIITNQYHIHNGNLISSSFFAVDVRPREKIPRTRAVGMMRGLNLSTSTMHTICKNKCITMLNAIKPIQ